MDRLEEAGQLEFVEGLPLEETPRASVEQGPVLTMEDYRKATAAGLVRGLFAQRMRELQNRNEAEFTSAWLGSPGLSPNWRSWIRIGP